MTLDQWTTQATDLLVTGEGMDRGSAAAYVQDMVYEQRRENGRNPAGWDTPSAAV